MRRRRRTAHPRRPVLHAGLVLVGGPGTQRVPTVPGDPPGHARAGHRPPAAHLGARDADGARQPRDRARRPAAWVRRGDGGAALPHRHHAAGRGRRLPAHRLRGCLLDLGRALAAGPDLRCVRDGTAGAVAVRPAVGGCSVTVSGERAGEGVELPGSATLAVRPLSIVPEGDEFVVGDAELSVYVVLPAIGVQVLGLLREGRTLDEAAERARQSAGEDVDVTAFARSLLQLGFATISDGVADADGEPRSRPKASWLG